MQSAFLSHGLESAEHSSISDEIEKEPLLILVDDFPKGITLIMSWSSVVLISSIPSQVLPSPVNPCLHVQLEEPSVLVQTAFSSQGLESGEHSLISNTKENGKGYKTTQLDRLWYQFHHEKIRVTCRICYNAMERRNIQREEKQY